MKKLKNREHVKWALSAAQRKNVKTLLIYLKKGGLPAGFTMARFSDEYDESATVCGTAGCIIGHGPHAGIVKSVDEVWSDYGNLRFAARSTLNSWRFIFSGLWQDFDNSLSGAVRRLEYALKFGIPQLTGLEIYNDDYFFRDITSELNEKA